MVHNIDVAAFQRMVIHGAAAISAQKQPINDLNVFPVPDGDTGTNMSLTIGAAAAEMKRTAIRLWVRPPGDRFGPAAGPGQLPASSCLCCSAALPRRSGEGNHGRPGSGYRSGFRRGRRL